MDLSSARFQRSKLIARTRRSFSIYKQTHFLEQHDSKQYVLPTALPLVLAAHCAFEQLGFHDSSKKGFHEICSARWNITSK